MALIKWKSDLAVSDGWEIHQAFTALRFLFRFGVLEEEEEGFPLNAFAGYCIQPILLLRSRLFVLATAEEGEKSPVPLYATKGGKS